MTDLATATDVHSYWTETLEPKNWYVAKDAVDQAIRDQFLVTWQAAHDGGCQDWIQNATGALSYIILTDQFPRHMFRGDGRSFATDTMAVNASQQTIARGWDQEIPEPVRQFIYIPFMHAEDLEAQQLGIDYFATRMPETGHSNIDHAHAHHWVIAKFGRFPYRNAALGRDTTPQEQQFLDAGGYRYALEQVKLAN